MQVIINSSIKMSIFMLILIMVCFISIEVCVAGSATHNLGKCARGLYFWEANKDIPGGSFSEFIFKFKDIPGGSFSESIFKFKEIKENVVIEYAFTKIAPNVDKNWESNIVLKFTKYNRMLHCSTVRRGYIFWGAGWDETINDVHWDSDDLKIVVKVNYEDRLIIVCADGKKIGQLDLQENFTLEDIQLTLIGTKAHIEVKALTKEAGKQFESLFNK